ncbi:MAG: glycosyltransferase involved in cell wall biosynthesis, partial [bacterium]
AVEAVQDGVTGYLVNPENLNEIVDKVNILFKYQGLRKKFGKSGKSWAKLFLWENKVEMIHLITQQFFQQKVQIRKRTKPI